MSTYTKSVLSDSEYLELKNRYDEYHKQRKIVCGDRNYTTPEDQKLLPQSLTNEQISQLEVYEWINNPPTKYFSYVDFRGGNLTTWTGEKLGEIDFISKWVSNMGDTRYSIRVFGTNGKQYYGTYFSSSGDYCRITARK